MNQDISSSDRRHEHANTKCSAHGRCKRLSTMDSTPPWIILRIACVFHITSVASMFSVYVRLDIMCIDLSNVIVIISFISKIMRNIQDTATRDL